MSLADRIESDVMGVFFRESEFARKHDLNGREIICIIDGEQALAHRNMNTLSVEWDVGSIDMVVRIPAGQLEEMPVENETLFLDGRMKRVMRVTDNEGEWILELHDNEARSVV